MKSILECADTCEPTIEEVVLYDLIDKMLVIAEVARIYGYDTAMLCIRIKAILILFEACGLNVDTRYWEWLNNFQSKG